MTYPWNAGEVLAAADLNAEFASKLPYSYGTATPSTSVDGFLWYDENDTPPTPKFWDGSAFQNVAPAGGLELITTEIFSAVSSVSVNNCFSGSYKNYRLLISGTSSGTGVDLRFRWRVGGSDNSTASSYVRQQLIAASTTVAASRQTLDYGAFGQWSSTLISTSSVDVFDVFAADQTGWLAHTLSSENDAGMYNYFGNHNQTTSYDGITLYPSSGTFTGTLRVYGYKD